MVIGTKSQVFKGTADQTSGGLRRQDILRVKSPNGGFRYKSARKSTNASRSPALADWRDALQEARRRTGLTTSAQGKLIVPRKNGGSPAQRRLYDSARDIFDRM